MSGCCHITLSVCFKYTCLLDQYVFDISKYLMDTHRMVFNRNQYTHTHTRNAICAYFKQTTDVLARSN